jgi:hypothetical protein
LYLAQLDVTTLPRMVVLTSIVAFAMVSASSKGLAWFSPRLVVPLTFLASAALFAFEWTLTTVMPRVAAVLLYLHVAGLGPVLGSGFWLVASERFDPRTAKHRYGRIAAVGTLGGLLGGLLAERFGAWFGLTAVIPFLAVLNALTAIGIWYLAGDETRARPSPSDDQSALTTSGLHVLARVPYMRNLAALIFLGATSAALVDYVFKAQAVTTFGRGETLLRFFAIYYAATSVLTFLVQTFGSQRVLQRFGLAFATGLPSLAILGGSVLSLLLPGLRSLVGTRGAESVFRGSLFRLGYELFYTPIPVNEKRAVKSVIDVGVERLGDAVGAGIIALMLMLPPAQEYGGLLYLTILLSGVAVILSSRLNRGYIYTLENSLRHQALDLELSEELDRTTRTTLLRTVGDLRSLALPKQDSASGSLRKSTAAVEGLDPDVQDIVVLRSRDPGRVSPILRRENGISPVLVPHVIPLLAWSPVSTDAVFALRKVAEEHIGELTDALIDPSQDFAVRRRLARVFAVCVSQRAADGLLRGLEDPRFEVRFQCGRSLSAVQQANPNVKIDREAILEVILREMAVSRSVWEGQRLLDALDSHDAIPFVDEFVRDRAGQSLAHVFTLLALVLPREPLQIAFRGIHADDQHLRGTALEYLEGVLPARIKDRLWPFLEDDRPASRTMRPREEILADLLRSNQSIMVNIEELRKRFSKA